MLPEIQNRISPVIFEPKPVERDKLLTVLEAARWAPSSYNHQPWRYLVIEEKEALEKAHKGIVLGNFWAKQAPVLIVVLSKPDLDDQIDGKDYYLYDTGLSVMSLVIEAEHSGLSCHQMIGFKEDVLKKEFKIPDEWRVIVVMALGYKGDMQLYKGSFVKKFGMQLFEQLRERIAHPRVRKPMLEIASFNKFGV